METAIYQPNDNVQSFHNVPRFGFPDNVAVLFSNDDESEKEEYINGLVYFSVMLILLFFLWVSILFVLKFVYGVSHVGCAAGGKPIHVSQLRDDGVRRWERRKRMERSWAVQNVFLICCFGIPAFSAVVVNRGIDPFLDSLTDVSETAAVFHSKARRGINIAKVLSTQYHDLDFYLEMDMTRLCPNYERSPWAAEQAFFATTSNLQASIGALGSFVGDGTDRFVAAMNQIMDASDGVQGYAGKIHSKDWILRAFLLILNALTAFLAIGALLAKNRIDHSPMQKLLAYVLVPMFALTLIGFVACTCIVAGLAVVNADFCAGGGSTESPIGTLREFSHLMGYGEQSVFVRSLGYYSDQNCEGPYPLQFVLDLNEDIYRTVQMLDSTLLSLRENDADLLTAECESDIRPLNATYLHVSRGLKIVAGNLRATISSTTCPSIWPLLDDLKFGASCTDSINGAAWLFSSLLAMSILGMIMLTTRAAMYNPVITASKKKRREKEFHQYKGFMSTQGYDTSDWLLDPGKKKLLEEEHKRTEGPPAVTTTYTFETEDTSTGTQRLTPDSLSSGESESSSSHFFDEDAYSASIRQSSSDLPTIVEDNVIVEAGDADYNEDMSVYSYDSDDSSVHPPPSVISTVASGLTDLVHQLRRSPNKKGSNDGLSGFRQEESSDPPVSSSFSSFVASPIKFPYQQKIASLFQFGDDKPAARQEEPEWTPPDSIDPYTTLDDVDPPTPQPARTEKQPDAPQKAMSTFPRTIINV